MTTVKGKFHWHPGDVQIVRPPAQAQAPAPAAAGRLTWSPGDIEVQRHSVTWDDLLAVIDLSAQTAALEGTPAPYGKPGGPGLYGVAGNKHSDYFEQVVQALMAKRGMDKAKASQVAWGVLRKWARGGGGVHPEVAAAASKALAGEAAASAKAGGHSHAASWDDVARVIEMASSGGRHVPGTDYEWEHGYKPLTSAAATSHFSGKIPKGWQAASGSAGPQPGGDLASGARNLAAHVRAAGPVSPRNTGFGPVNDREEAAASLDKAAGHFDAGRHAEGTKALLTAKRHLDGAAATAISDARRNPQSSRLKASKDAAAGHYLAAQEGHDRARGVPVLTRTGTGADGSVNAVDQNGVSHKISLNENGTVTVTRAGRTATVPAGENPARTARLASMYLAQGRGAKLANGRDGLAPVELATVLEFFNPAETRLPVGPGGGQFTAGGAQPASGQQPAKGGQPAKAPAKPLTAAQKHALHVAHVAHVNHVSTAKAKLLVTADDDRKQAAALIRQRDVLAKALASASGKTSSGQAGAKTSTNATTSTTAPAAAKTASTTAAPASTGTASTTASAPKAPAAAAKPSASASATSAAGLKTQIAALNTQINGLLAQAKQAEAQAAKTK